MEDFAYIEFLPAASSEPNSRPWLDWMLNFSSTLERLQLDSPIKMQIINFTRFSTLFNAKIRAGCYFLESTCSMASWIDNGVTIINSLAWKNGEVCSFTYEMGWIYNYQTVLFLQQYLSCSMEICRTWNWNKRIWNDAQLLQKIHVWSWVHYYVTISICTSHRY